MEFVKRDAELRELDTAAKQGGLLVVFGRRRVGKTRLLRQWLQPRDGLYSQAIEAQRDLQIQQLFADLRLQLKTQLVRKTWPELLEILALQKRRWALCLDEFPYLTAVDASLPSQLQKWLDHSLPRGCLLIVAGSSTRMMNGFFLHRAAPSTAARESSCRSGRWTTPRSAMPVTFGRATGIRSRNSPLLVATTPGCIHPDARTAVRGKRSLHQENPQDPTMRFWFRVYSPHQSRWRTYAITEKRKLIHDHAATVFEDFCRACFPGSQRYRERNIELDLSRAGPE